MLTPGWLVEKWYLDRGEGFLFFSNNRSLVSLLKYRGRDKVRLIRRLKRVNEQLSLLHRCDPEPRALRFHETLRFLKYIKKAGKPSSTFRIYSERIPSWLSTSFFFFFFSFKENSYPIIAANSPHPLRRTNVIMNYKKENPNILSIIFRFLIKHIHSIKI